MKKSGLKALTNHSKVQLLLCLPQEKNVIMGDVGVFDTSLILSRVLCLQKVRDIDMKDVMGYKLVRVPPLMFDETGEMRITKSKSTLK